MITPQSTFKRLSKKSKLRVLYLEAQLRKCDLNIKKINRELEDIKITNDRLKNLKQYQEVSHAM